MAPIVVVAAYAAVISTLSLVVAVLAYRSSRRAQLPDLLPTSSLRPSDGTSLSELRITVRNNGGATGEVVGIELNVPGPHTIPLGPKRIPLFGPTLPEQIPPHSVRTWAVEANALIAITNQSAWQPKVRAVVTTGNLERVWESIHEYTELR